jgi:hypothetical protein
LLQALAEITEDCTASVSISTQGIRSMNRPGLQQALTLVISEILARNRSYFGAGGPGYYGVEVDNLSSDGSKFDLDLTFKSGVRYCCVEYGCHIPLHGSGKSFADWFNEVRERLSAAGFVNLPPITVKKLHVVAEKGVMCGGNDSQGHDSRTLDNRLEFDYGPFCEVVQPDGEPTYS